MGIKMKFFWKIFFAFTVLVTVVFSIFGIWMISLIFSASFDKVIDEGNRENRMFQYAFEMNLNSLPESYQNDVIAAQLVKGLTNNLDNKEYGYKVYMDRIGVIFESGKDAPEQMVEHDIIDSLTEENTCGYEIVNTGQEKKLFFVCLSEVKGRIYYLESVRDVSNIYEERDELYARYRLVMFVLLACSGIIIFIISHFLTRSVVTLSEAARRFAEGSYEIRAVERGEDEIGKLAMDFNAMADALVEKMDELKGEARRQEDFTASFAHELKTPLTAVIGYADMLRTMELDKQETMEAANYIFSQGKRLESLSLKLLDLLVTQNQEVQFKEIGAYVLFREVEAIVTPMLGQKNIKLEMELEEGTIYGDRELLASLFMNLIDNAKKALGENGTIRLIGSGTMEGYKVSVIDNGCGMPEEEIEKITEAFYMVDKSRARKEGGAGLGMTLCQKIVSLHDAHWVIKSSQGEGTKVTVYFHDREEPYEGE